MNSLLRLGALALTLSLSTPFASAQSAPAASAPAWKYKTKRLGNAEIDALLAKPASLLVLDLRRPDELIKFGSFPVFLSVQAKDLEGHLAYLPKDRRILTVSNHAGRAGVAGDLLSARGFTVVGAAGAEDYEKAGGLAVVHIQPPAPAVAAASAPR